MEGLALLVRCLLFKLEASIDRLRKSRCIRGSRVRHSRGVSNARSDWRRAKRFATGMMHNKQTVNQ